MTEVMLFGQKKIMAENPWYEAGMSDKKYYLRDPQDWVGDKTQLTAAQKKATKAFTKAAKASIETYPADGTFTTLQKRVKSIGEELEGKVYTSAAKLRERLPESATEGHPLREKLARAT